MSQYWLMQYSEYAVGWATRLKSFAGPGDHFEERHLLGCYAEWLL
jgi:hypothetical protein